jgi:hypothetical protein
MNAEADKSITSANGMLHTAKGEDSIKDLAAKQLEVAHATQDQAADLLDSAHGMENKSARINAQANLDLAVAARLRRVAVAEKNMSEALGARADALAAAARNASEKAREAQAAAKQQGDKKVEITKVAEAKQAAYEAANQNIMRADAEIKEAMGKISTADGILASSKVLNDTAHQEREAALAVYKELELQNESFQETMAATKGMKAADAIVAMTEQDMDTVTAEKQKIAQELAGAKILQHKAEVTQAEAEKSIAAAKAMKEAAEKAKEAAIKVKEGIDSDELVGDAGAGTVLAMQTLVDSKTGVVQAMVDEKQATTSAIEAYRDLANAELAHSAQLRSMTDTATDAGKEVIEAIMKHLSQVAQDTDRKAAKLTDSLAQVGVISANKTAQEAFIAAKAQEDQILEKAMKRRSCVDMPGVQVKLQNSAEREFARLIGSDPTSTHEECKEKCRRHAACKQVVFSWAKGCQLSDQASGEAMDFTEAYNSSFCGGNREKNNLMDMLHKVYEQKPYIPDPVLCSWSGEDCSHTKCCNHFEASWNYKNIVGQTCYKQDEKFASCRSDMPPAWGDGAGLGGAREPRELPKAGKSKLTQGTSLFCFSVVMWSNTPTKEYYSSEAELANNWIDKGLGIMQCDENAAFEGEDAPITDWGAINNADAFIHAWEYVRQDGRYKNHDWVVKVDVDAVFFPDRLKTHLDSLKIPQHAKAYVWNSDATSYHFAGALEVITSEALDTYFLNANTCSKKQKHNVGEDFYMKSCLDGIGIDHVTDFQLLYKKDSCADGWAAVFHPKKSVNDWKDCHQEAVAAQ